MIARFTLPGDCLSDCTDEDRADLLRAGLSQDCRFALPSLAFVSMSLPDAQNRLAERIAERRIVIALASIAQKEQRIAALNGGAHEFLTTGPIDPPQLEARLRLLGTGSALPRNLSLDPDAQALVLGEEIHSLTPREFDVCAALVAANGRFVAHESLIEPIWGKASSDRQRLRVVINRLRSRIEPEPDLPRYFLSEPAIGYRMGSGGSARPISAL